MKWFLILMLLGSLLASCSKKTLTRGAFVPLFCNHSSTLISQKTIDDNALLETLVSNFNKKIGKIDNSTIELQQSNQANNVGELLLASKGDFRIIILKQTWRPDKFYLLNLNGWSNGKTIKPDNFDFTLNGADEIKDFMKDVEILETFYITRNSM